MRLSRVASSCCVLSLLWAPGQAAATETTPNGFGSGYETAGYSVLPQTLTGVRAGWVVPTVTCPKPAAAVSFSIAMQDVNTGRFVRLGTDVDCHQGKPSYGAWIRLPGFHRASLKSRVRPGDIISARLYLDHGRVGAGFANRTQGYFDIISTNAHMTAQRAIVAIGKRRSGLSGFHALAGFGSVRFTHCSVNGHTFGHNLTRLSMKSRLTGERLVKTGVFTRPAGTFQIHQL